MASNGGLTDRKFKALKTQVAQCYDDNKCLTMLKVLFRDKVDEESLAGITCTMDLLNDLHKRSEFGPDDLTLLHDTISITKYFALGKDLTKKYPSFPDVKEGIISTKFTLHRQKLMKLGMTLILADVTKIDGMYNAPLKRYPDSWSMITDLEDNLEIGEGKMEEFIDSLKTLNLRRALKALTEEIGDTTRPSSTTDAPDRANKDTSQEEPYNMPSLQSQSSCKRTTRTKSKKDEPKEKSRRVETAHMSTSDVGESSSQNKKGYLMLSYSWKHKQVVEKIRQRLEKDYKIWIDKKDMVGDIDKAMAKAVKEVDLVLVCLSKAYEESDNCRAEVRCLKEFKTDSIPLMMEKYEVDSWVASTFGRELYVDFSNMEEFDERFEYLLTRINLKLQRLNITKSTPQAGTQQPTTNPDTKKTHSAPDSRHSEEPYQMPELSKLDLNTLLDDLSSWWELHGSVNMLKVLLSDFKSIQVADIQKKSKPIDLFRLLLADEVISCSNIDVLAKAAVVCGQSGVYPIIRKKVPTYPKLSEVVRGKFSNHRLNLLEFGRVMSTENRKRIAYLVDLNPENFPDQWSLILELEKKRILTEETKKTFSETIGKSGMNAEAEALNKF